MEKPTAAQQLTGRRLPNGWVVVGPVIRPSSATGGHFSHSYIVESSEGKRAFLKALDFSKAFASPDAARALQAMTEAYNHERDLLNACGTARMSRIIRALDSASIVLDQADVANTTVQYIIFELATCDVRTRISSLETLDLAWSLRALHSVAVALSQLHRRGIAHQDVKPSNLLEIDNGHKLCDLGRASIINRVAPHDDLLVAGDRSYAPPELLYGYVSGDWRTRRLGCDLYLLGSMVVFFFTLTNATSLLLSNLSPSLRPDSWKGTFTDVLPYLVDAYAKSLHLLSQKLPSAFGQDLLNAVAHLCAPDPARRGHPGNVPGEQFSLQRYVSLFNLLAGKAELKLHEDLHERRAAPPRAKVAKLI